MRPSLGGYQLVFIGLPFIIRISPLPGLGENRFYGVAICYKDFVPCILKVIHTTVDYNNVKVKVIIFDGRMEKVHPLGYEPVR